MGDFQNQQVGAEQDDLQNRDAQAVAAEYPATAQVRQMLGSPNAYVIAKIIQEHPKARNEIMALIHKSLGNGFAQEVVSHGASIMRAESDDRPAIKEGHRAAPGSKNALSDAEIRANAEDNSPLNTPLGGNSAASSAAASGGPSKAQTAAMEIDAYEAELKPSGKQSDASTPAPASAAPASGGPSKAQSAAMEIDAYEAELKPSGKPADASTPAPARFKPPSQAAKDDAAAEVFKDDPRRGKFSSDELRNIADGDGSALDKKPGASTEASPAEAPVAASKVLKDETVIASSAEVKQPEILRASEVLQDPNQSEEPQKASDVVKDDDAENEGSAGGAKADAGPVKITASVLRVRSSPKISKGNIVGRLTKGDVVEAIGHSGEWVEIKYKGQTAFVHSSFVVGAQETAVAKAPDQAAPATTT